ncbi:deoxynucleoside kinase [Candidatus Dependentiae bacterium]|nr:deoxynucleoside kinase [Candidatus Dependentiae bacterium]
MILQDLPKRIMVEGNIGSGKSTFLKIIKEKLGIEIIYEPCHKWQNIAGHNLLDQFYKDPKRWSYTFQTYAFATRIFDQENSNSSIQIFERSVFSDRFCFAKNCYESGLMSDLEWQLYNHFFSWLVENYCHKPSGFIYLRTEPETCYQRILKRSRSEEASISLDYIKDLHQKHENWLVNKIDIPKNLANIPVLIIDCDKEFEKDLSYQNEILQKVAEFTNLNYENRAFLNLKMSGIVKGK